MTSGWSAGLNDGCKRCRRCGRLKDTRNVEALGSEWVDEVEVEMIRYYGTQIKIFQKMNRLVDEIL